MIPAPSLANAVFAEVSPKFFSLLSGPNARLYLDLADLLESESTRRPSNLERDEAISLAAEWLETSGAVAAPESDTDVPESLVPRDRARVLVERLRDAGWLREETLNDWSRQITFDENAALILGSLRTIASAHRDPLRFSDKLVNVCLTLCGPQFREDPWAQLQACTTLVTDGLKELRLMGKSIIRHTRRQLESATLRDNLALVFDEFSGKITNACYAGLVRARLPARLADARRALDGMHLDAQLLERMRTDFLSRPGQASHPLDDHAAATQVANGIEDLANALARVIPLADEIDRHTSDFARKSLARFRYLQEVAGERREAVQTFFETLGTAFAGKTYRDMEALEASLPAPRLPDPRVLSGIDSLFTPRLRSEAGEIEPLDEEADADATGRARIQLQNALRDSLTLGRANRFAASLPGERIASSRIPLPTTDELEDLIACLLHAGSARAAYDIELDRFRSAEETPHFTSTGAILLESFTLVKK